MSRRLHASVALFTGEKATRYPLNILTDLYKIWYEISTIGSHPSLVLFNFLYLVTATRRTLTSCCRDNGDTTVTPNLELCSDVRYRRWKTYDFCSGNVSDLISGNTTFIKSTASAAFRFEGNEWCLFRIGTWSSARTHSANMHKIQYDSWAQAKNTKKVMVQILNLCPIVLKQTKYKLN